VTAMTIQRDWHCVSAGEAVKERLEQYAVRSSHIPGQPGSLADGMTHEALPTSYAGTTFRSALEASWAATLDTLDIVWEYEPETVTLPSGTTYIPDFRLPDIGCWLEVKGPGVPRVEKAHEFGESLACGCGIWECSCRWPGGQLVLIGYEPRPYRVWDDPKVDHLNYRVAANIQRRHGGHPDWESTRGRTAWLTRCTACDRGTWFDRPGCRACGGPLADCHGYRPGEPGLEFRRIRGLVRPATNDDTKEI